MATAVRRADPPLGETLFEEGYRFDFFEAVRILERLLPDRAAVGREGPPDREVVRFRSHLTLAFPASSVHHLDRAAEADGPLAMTVSFMGLTGPMGVLPQVYTELLLERRRSGDRTAGAFLDLFNHRMVSLFFRAWEKYRVAISYERGEGERFSRFLLDFMGLGGRGLRDRHEFPDAVLLFYTGFFAQRHRPAVVLERLLQDAFGQPVEVHQFVGQWLKLEPGDRSVLSPAGPHNQLGVSLVLGDRVWDEQGKFRIRIGPLTFDRFREFLPDGPPFRRLAQMARLFVDGEFDFDVQLVLRADEVPESRLTSAAGAGPRLGRYAWLKSREFARDADDAVFAAGV